MCATAEEKRLRSNLRWPFVDQILEDGALRLWVDLDAAILVALPVHCYRARHMVAFDHICQTETTHLAAADAGIEEQQQDRCVAQRVSQLAAGQVDHAPDVG